LVPRRNCAPDYSINQQKYFRVIAVIKVRVWCPKAPRDIHSDIPFIRSLEVKNLAKISVNKKVFETDADPATPVLWIIRDEIGLTGTKFGCGIAQCGSCTIHIDGEPRRSCITPLSTVAGKEITTIEGLSENSDHPLQKAWVETDVPQCGYCQSGQIMAAASLLKKTKNPTDADIDTAMNGIICRCGTYNRIRAAIKQAATNGGK
jgi:isoquinoline 1-oxidoreductase alpha subunit